MEARLLLATDVKALFPSMTGKNTARIVKEEFIRSKLEVEVEWKEMGRYLAINCQQEELRKVGTRGHKPTIGGNEARSAGIKEGETGQWEFVYDLEPGPDVKGRMTGKVLEIVGRTYWTLQTYEFGGRVFPQE